MVIAPAGWFDDPTGLELNRWWNGTEWTEHTSPKPAVLVGVESVGAESAPGSAAAGRAGVGSARVAGVELLGAGSVAPVSLPRAPDLERVPHDMTHTYVPFGDQRSWQGHVAPVATAPTRWNTPGAVAVAFTPWVGLLASAGLVALALLATGAWWWWVGGALLPLLWSIAFAVRDRNKLESWGYQARPSLAWLLLGPLAYLIARTVRIHQRVRRGSLPLWMLVINSVLIAALVVGVGIGLGTSIAARATTAVETGTEAGLRARGLDYSVACPASLDVFVVGSTFDCVASDATGTVGTVTVKITGSNGAFAYRLTPTPSTGA